MYCTCNIQLHIHSMYIMCMRCVGFASCVVCRCGVLGPRAFSTHRMTLRNGTALKELHTLIEEACDGMAYQPVWGRIVKFSTGFQLWKLPLICRKPGGNVLVGVRPVLPLKHRNWITIKFDALMRGLRPFEYKWIHSIWSARPAARYASRPTYDLVLRHHHECWWRTTRKVCLSRHAKLAMGEFFSKSSILKEVASASTAPRKASANFAQTS